MKKSLIVLILLLISKISPGQDIRINAGNGKFIIDNNLKLIVCNKNIAEFNDLVDVNSLSINLDGGIYEFSNIPNELEYGEQYRVTFSSQNYKLYFSNLPLININTSNQIVDEPKVSANFILTDTTDAEAITSYCGIEIRGAYTRYLPKKSYGIELWKDETGDDDNKISLLNMRDDDDWVLIAMYNEPLRIRSVISYELWREIHTPYYIDNEEDAMSGIRTKYIELAVNNEYMGVYALGERVDRKQLKLKNINHQLEENYTKVILVTLQDLVV